MGKSAVSQLSLQDAVAPQLHKVLRDRIVSCDLAPGTRISETEIATTYDVSRQPVREAFIKLSEEKLVSVRPQRGTFIQRISVPAALTARFIREAVEVELVRRAVQSVTLAMIKALDIQIQQQWAEVSNDDPIPFMQLDEAFHKALVDCAKAPPVSQYLDGLNVHMNRVRIISARQLARDNIVRQHAQIVDALRNQDGDAAERAMRTHLAVFNNDLPKIIEAFPDYFDGTEALL